MRAPRRHHGLTLMEVVVALAVVSVLMAALYASFRTAAVAERSGSSAIYRMQSAAEAIRLLRTDLQGVMQPGGAMGGYVDTDAAEDADRLTNLYLRSNSGMIKVDYVGLTRADLTTDLLSRWPVQPVGADVQEVTWSVRSDSANPGRSMLVRATTRNVLALQQPTRTERVVLRDIHGVRVRYYNGQEWRTHWDTELEGQRLPIAVEITIDLADGSGSTTFGERPGRPVTTVVTLPMSRMAEEMGGVRR